jgi:hypothetical protein
MACMRCCRYAEAERRFREAVAEARLGFPPGDPHIPSALHYLAELYRNTRRYNEAQPLYEEVRASRAVRGCCGDRCNWWGEPQRWAAFICISLNLTMRIKAADVLQPCCPCWPFPACATQRAPGLKTSIVTCCAACDNAQTLYGEETGTAGVQWVAGNNRVSRHHERAARVKRQGRQRHHTAELVTCCGTSTW